MAPRADRNVSPVRRTLAAGGQPDAEQAFAARVLAARAAETAPGSQQRAALASSIPLLVSMLGSSSSRDVLTAAVHALRCIVEGSRGMQQAAVDAGAAAALAPLLGSGDEFVQRSAAAMLTLLCKGNPGMGAQVAAAEGVVPALLAQLAGCASPRVRPIATEALRVLTLSGRAAQATLVSAGAVPALLPLLGSGSESEQLNAARALSGLAGRQTAVVPRIVASGAVPAIVGLLRAGSRRLQYEATLLTLIVSESRCAADALAAAQAAPALQRLLFSCSEENTRQLAAVALDQLAVPRIPPPGSEPSVQELAAAAAARAQPPRVCAAEGCQRTAGLRKCGGCRAVRYCGEACCSAHWPDHRPACHRLRAVAAAAAAGAAEPPPQP